METKGRVGSPPAMLSKVLEKTAHRDVRDEPLAFQLGARGGRGVVGAEPLYYGRALVRETIERADGVGHDLGCDRTRVLVKHLRCHRCASRPTATAQGTLSLQAGAGGLGGGSAGGGGDAARPARKHARAHARRKFPAQVPSTRSVGILCRVYDAFSRSLIS
jgi:hypothetical protein